MDLIMKMPIVVKELVKNAIDAQSTFVKVEINEKFDLRIIDDGIGFDEEILETIGKRQVFISNGSEKFRYGKNGKFLLTVVQDIEQMYIESIQRNSDIRFFKSINYYTETNIYRTSREQKDAIVLTEQGSSVVVSNFAFQVVSDPISLKRGIKNEVMELALINFNIKFSIKDTATQTMLLVTERTDTLFAKFKHLLESNRVYSKLHFASYQRFNVKVELFICEQYISSKSFQFVYLNKLIESDGKWMNYLNRLCEIEFENGLTGKFAVYLADIRITNYFEKKLEDNLTIIECIKKCFKQLMKPSSKNRTAKSNYQDHVEFLNKDDPGVKHQSNCNESEMQGVPLGDWIFNNSCEDYEMFDQGKVMYRNKVCENWVMSLGKAKPKDSNDSLDFVNLEKIRHNDDDDVFRKSLKRNIRKPYARNDKVINTVTANHILTPLIPPWYIPEPVTAAASNHVLTRLRPPRYIPEPVTAAASNHVLQPLRPPRYIPEPVTAAASNRVLQPLRPSRYISEPVTAAASNYVLTPFKPSQYVEDLNISTLERARELLKKHDMDFQSNLHMNVHASEVPINPSDNNQNCPNARVSTSQLLDFPFNNDVESRDRLQIYKSVKETFDFEFHNNLYKSNVNMTFSSPIVSSDIHDGMNDPFMKFLENELSAIKLNSDFFENHQSLNTPQSTNPPSHFASACHAISQVEYHRQRGNNSSSTRRRSEINSRMSHQSKSIRSSSDTRTTVVPKRNTSTSMNDDIYQNGRPVTINIHFGESK